MKLWIRRSPLRLFSVLPQRLRGWLIRWGTPSFHVGALSRVERDDGTVLLVRDVYRRGWGLPGGLLKRREHPDAGARREALEEVGLVLELDPSPVVVVDPRARRVDIVYRARAAAGQKLDDIAPVSAEIAEVRWFSPDALPALHPEAGTALVELARRPRERKAVRPPIVSG